MYGYGAELSASVISPAQMTKAISIPSAKKPLNIVEYTILRGTFFVAFLISSDICLG
jgi:hypothetical protein